MSDIYIVTDISQNCVFYLDPVSYDIINCFGSYGRGDTQFNWPISVCCDKSGHSPHVVVSDHRNAAVKFFDPTGNFEKLISIGDRIRQKGVYGVAMDTRGRILVCDQSQRQVLRVWPEAGPGVPLIEDILPTPNLQIGVPYIIDTTSKGLVCLTTDASSSVKDIMLFMGYL